MTLITNSALLKNRTSIQPFETPDVLITSGLFKLSRNPLYLGMAIAFFGLVITLGSLSPFIFPIIFVIIINRVIIPYEENKLEIVFGDKYLDYKTKTRRWFWLYNLLLNQNIKINKLHITSWYMLLSFRTARFIWLKRTVLWTAVRSAPALAGVPLLVSRFLSTRLSSSSRLTLHLTTSAKTRATATLWQGHLSSNVSTH